MCLYCVPDEHDTSLQNAIAANDHAAINHIIHLNVFAIRTKINKAIEWAYNKGHFDGIKCIIESGLQLTHEECALFLLMAPSDRLHEAAECIKKYWFVSDYEACKCVFGPINKRINTEAIICESNIVRILRTTKNKLLIDALLQIGLPQETIDYVINL